MVDLQPHVIAGQIHAVGVVREPVGDHADHCADKGVPHVVPVAGGPERSVVTVADEMPVLIRPVSPMMSTFMVAPCCRLRPESPARFRRRALRRAEHSIRYGALRKDPGFASNGSPQSVYHHLKPYRGKRVLQLISLPEGTMVAEKMNIGERSKDRRMMPERYVNAGRQEKAGLLDELEAMTGLPRKDLLARLSTPDLRRQRRHRARSRLDGPDGEQVVRVVAEALAWIGAERLQPGLAGCTPVSPAVGQATRTTTASSSRRTAACSAPPPQPVAWCASGILRIARLPRCSGYGAPNGLTADASLR